MSQGLVIISIIFRASFRNKQECIFLTTVTVPQNCSVHSESVLALHTTFIAVFHELCVDVSFVYICFSYVFIP